MTQKISRYIDVAVPLPVRQPFTYRVPEAARGCSDPGARALVPVGRRLLTGVIAREVGQPAVDLERVKEVVDLPDAAPVIPAQTLSLALWAARYYASPPGATLAAAVPPGLGRRSETMVSRLAAHPPENLGPRERGALEAIPASGAVPARRLGLPASVLSRLEEAGLVKIELALSKVRVKAKRATVLHANAAEAGRALVPSGRAPRQRAVLDLVASAGEKGMPIEEVYDRAGRVGPSVKALLRKGLLRATRVERLRSPLVPDAAPGRSYDLDRVPTREQGAALEAIGGALAAGTARAFLLMGVTGSGKTEVYLRAIERCLAAGRDALYLVPEITLTPLLARELRARLGGSLAILHSSLGPGERFDEWRRARQGEARVVLGARSAVFAPLRDLGLIVVDEEQDGSYKQQEDPRYNARDLALVRAKDSGAVVVLGSATPSIESYHAAARRRFELLSLPGRIHARPMARVKLVDMRQEFLRTGREDLVSAPLREAVAGRLARGEQAIILLNRRGYAPFTLCRSCGAAEKCKRCSVTLTYHRAESRMKCHYCGYWRGRPSSCSTCGSEKIALSGAGTERLEEQMRRIFPEARIARLDRDTARGRRAPAEILSAFERGEFNLMVGTQMVAKGHDFPAVTIVGVLGADNVLGMPDFRAAEKTFQLLTQVAGRSGRGTEPGEVIVQAFHSEHYAIEAAARQDYSFFYEKESRYRMIMRYPPFSVMANLVVQAPSPEVGVKRARMVAEALARVADRGMQIIGPAVAPIARLKGRYRYQILVKSGSRRRLSDALNGAAVELSQRGLSSSRDLVIDMDPVTLS